MKLYRAFSRQANRLALNIPVLQGLLREDSQIDFFTQSVLWTLFPDPPLQSVHPPKSVIFKEAKRNLRSINFQFADADLRCVFHLKLVLLVHRPFELLKAEKNGSIKKVCLVKNRFFTDFLKRPPATPPPPPILHPLSKRPKDALRERNRFVSLP